MTAANWAKEVKLVLYEAENLKELCHEIQQN